MIEMVKVWNECLFVDFIDMEKAYDIVNRKKLFEVWEIMEYKKNWCMS